MRISEIFNLGKSQSELDFVDIDIKKDIPLFLDPSFLAKRRDRWSFEASRTIKSFFQKVVDLIRAGRVKEAKELFNYLHEPNSTCLGLSKNKPQGKGLGKLKTDDIFDNIIKSKAIKTGLIRDLEDNIIFIDDFGKDMLSDMTTNIIRKHLIIYTQNQCRLHNIKLNLNVPSSHYWDKTTNEWENEYTEMLVIGSKIILLVPKAIVSYCSDFVPEKYYNHFVLNFLQNEHLKLRSILVKSYNDGTRYVTKKSLIKIIDADIDKRNITKKEYLKEFTQKHPEIFDKFKNETKTKSLDQSELENFNISKITKYLISKLRGIETGTEKATEYHHCISGILELLFYPHLINPVLEHKIHQGRKRIDITFDNAAEIGIFRRMSDNMRIPCSYIMIECKNYSSDPENPELDQLAGRFSYNIGQFGLLLCRQIRNLSLFTERCRDTFKDGRGLIVPITDIDVFNMLEKIGTDDTDYVEQYISQKVREIAL